MALAAVCMLLCRALDAQTPGYGSVGGFVSVSGRSFSMPVNGAAVTLVSQGDTLRATVVNGRYSFKKVRAGKARVEAAYVGYKTTGGEVVVKANANTWYNIVMEDAPMEMDTVSVKGRVRAMIRNGDTLVYNAGAVGTLEGDYAEEILRQMPGVTIEEGKITVMGKNVERVYVDGKTLFGEGTMTALQNLKAADVIKIRAYDEDSEESIRNRRKNAAKRRVLDIETKSKLTSAITGDVLLSYGADISEDIDGKRRSRYAFGATLNWFSEKMNVTLDATTGNTGRSSNRVRDMLSGMVGGSDYRRNNTVELNVTRNFKKTDIDPKDSLLARFRITRNLSLRYAYEDSYARSQGFATADYFPVSGPEGYDSRINYDTTRNISTASSHNFSVNYMNPYNGLSARGNIKLWDRGGDNYHGGRIALNGASTVRTSSGDRSASDGYDVDASVGGDIPGKVSVNMYFVFSENGGDGWLADTLPTATNRQFLRNALGGYTRNISPLVSKNFPLINREDESLHLDLSYRFSYDKSLSKRTAVDEFTGMVDPGNTYDYISDQNTHRVTLGGVYRLGNRLMVMSQAGFASVGMNRSEMLPVGYDYSKRFNGFNPMVVVTCGDLFGDSFTFSYAVFATPPSIDQLRNQLDVSNPMTVRVGNPDLGQCVSHAVNLDAATINSARGSEMRMGLNFSVTRNAIVSKTLFFAREETLPGWNYTMQPGSTLSTYENVDSSTRAGANFAYSKYLGLIKSNLRTSLRVSYVNSPSYINNVPDDTKSYNPTLFVGLNGNFARRLSYRLGGGSSYNYSENSGGETNKTFIQEVNTELNWNITAWMFLNLTYDYRKLFAYSEFGRDDRSQVLNAVAGFNLFKRKCDVSVAVYDILNKDSGFSSSMTANYVLNSWRQTYGRYFLLSVAWRINASRSQGETFFMRTPYGGRGVGVMHR